MEQNGVTQTLKRLLFGIWPQDPTAFVGTAGVLTFVAMLTCYLPAWRASRVEPLEIPRTD